MRLTPSPQHTDLLAPASYRNSIVYNASHTEGPSILSSFKRGGVWSAEVLGRSPGLHWYTRNSLAPVSYCSCASFCTAWTCETLVHYRYLLCSERTEVRKWEKEEKRKEKHKRADEAR